ncbi:MAG: hypothetical protein JHD02_09000 [Thermoleophilaceae bacterium]|nr:hypothetical protein [Thermoleophilaceae bacterium]
MTPFERAVVELGRHGRDAIAQAHGTAIAVGGRFTGTSYESEAICSTQDLLCLAGDATVDLAMIAQIFEASPEAHEHAQLLRSAAAGVARLTARALEIHARDTGYDPEVWIADALDATELVMSDDRDPMFDGLRAGGECIALARRTASCIFAALACAPADRMGVPGHIADALGASVALFMIAGSTEHE